jgi:hypothetical protein
MSPSYADAIPKSPSEHDLRQTWPAVVPAFVTIMPGT